MASIRRPRLRAVQALPDYRLRLEFVSGQRFVLDCTDLIDASPGLAPLRDPTAFAAATIIPGEGWAVVWPALDIQIGADTLWLDIQNARVEDDNRREFVQWLTRHALSPAEAAAALGLPVRTVRAYGQGGRPIPRYVALACKGWEAESPRPVGNPHDP